MSGARWCDRTLHQCTYCFGLCTTEAQFHRELRRLKLPREDWPRFLKTTHANATVHFFEARESNGRCAIVCMPLNRERTGIEIAGLLVHEAVHIWQAHCEDIGEQNPASEQEAYAIQHISQQLMDAYSKALAA